jgi:hypothetical protein
MVKAFSAVAVVGLAITLISVVAGRADRPDPAHYAVRGNSIFFADNATDKDLAILDAHPELKAIDLGGSGSWDGPDPRRFPIAITDVGFAHVAKCGNLETLRLGFVRPCQVTDDGLRAIEGLARLRVVQLGVTPFGSAGLSHLAGLTNLEELWLDCNAGYDDAALVPVANLKKLRVLRFYTAPVTDAGLAKIRGLTQLEELQLGKSEVSDAGLRIIGGFTKLKTLDLQHTQITDLGLAHLKPLARLQWLCLDGTAVSSRGLATLADMTDMRWLFLENTAVDDAGLEHLQKMSALKNLYLSETRVTDAGIRSLTGLKHLAALKLDQLSLTDDAVDLLLKIRSLETLQINGTRITAAGLARLCAVGVKLINQTSSPFRNPTSFGREDKVIVTIDFPMDSKAETETGHVVVRYHVFDSGEAVSFRDVYDWAQQASHKIALSGKELGRVKEIVRHLPVGFAATPPDRSVIVTEYLPRGKRERIYDRAKLPAAMRELLSLLGGIRFELRNQVQFAPERPAPPAHDAHVPSVP